MVIVLMGVSGSGEKRRLANCWPQSWAGRSSRADDFHPPSNIEEKCGGVFLSTTPIGKPWLGRYSHANGRSIGPKRECRVCVFPP